MVLRGTFTSLNCCNSIIWFMIWNGESFNSNFTCTVVELSYLNDLVCPFSRKTFKTFAIGGTHKSPSEKADGCKENMKIINITKCDCVFILYRSVHCR